MPDHRSRNLAFSLVELSIVLVILGLLTGGILSGQSLIRAAELRQGTTKFSQYHAAIYTFRDKYFALPGDMTNATAFWQSAGGTGGDTTCITAQSTTQLTCNGNGDGRILYIGSSYNNDIERLLSWKHLANAGLVEGSYTGKTTGAPGTYEVIAGTNVPPAKVANGHFDLNYAWPNAAVFNPASRTDNNTIALYGPVSTEEAWNIDTKLDDGSPFRGKMFTLNFTIGPCATSADADAPYNVSAKGGLCHLFYVI